MKLHPDVERWRWRTGNYASSTGDDFGAFRIPGPCGLDLNVLLGPPDPEAGIDWEHVSVSTLKRCPNWQEMCFIKDLFFDPEETVMQLHPPKSRYVNIHPNCLHLWRPLKAEIPLPPLDAV